jgi:hypothetical protein
MPIIQATWINVTNHVKEIEHLGYFFYNLNIVQKKLMLLCYD